MKLNHKWGIFLAAPLVLLSISATTVYADSNVNQVNDNQQQQATTVNYISSQKAASNIQQSAALTNDTVDSSAVANMNNQSEAVSSASISVQSSAASNNTSATSNNEQTLTITNSQAQRPVNYSQLFTSLYSTYYTQEQVNNATYIYNYFIARGWTSQAIAGMLGNMVSESGIKPDIWEYGGGDGYGLVQWTPSSSVRNWCQSNGYNYTTLEGQCAYIQYQMTHGLQFYPSATSSMTAYQYMHSTASAYTLGLVFLANFERPLNPNQPVRGQQAQYWYQYFQTHGSTTAPTSQYPTSPSSNNSGSSVMNQSGTFRVAYYLNVRSAPSTSSSIVASYNGGQSFIYDSKVEANGYLWASFIGYSGARRYVAIKNLSNGTTYGYDSNNFSYTSPSTTTTTPSAPVTNTPTTTSNTMNQNGTFRVAYYLNIRSAPSTSASIIASYNGGQSFNYDSKIEANGYLWVSYISYSGARRYVAIKNLSNGTTYGYDSNNFSFNGTASSNVPTLSTTNQPTQGNLGAQVVAIARQQIGKPYVWGATGPNSFDCSGLVQYVYKQVGINLPRTTYTQSETGTAVSLNSLQSGDLLFWGGIGTAYHVAIYTGNGNMLFAPQPGQNVKEEPMSWWPPSFARRVL